MVIQICTILPARRSDGAAPLAGLLKGSDGALYGATSQGGSNHVGTVFKLNIDGSGYSVLRQLSTLFGEGRNPQAGLLEGSDGALYGTTYAGGSNSVGTAFKLEKNGTLYRVIVGFSSNAGDATGPQGGVALGTKRPALWNNSKWGAYGFGTIYNLHHDGSGYVVLHSFSRHQRRWKLWRGGSDCSQAMAGFMVQTHSGGQQLVSARFSK